MNIRKKGFYERTPVNDARDVLMKNTNPLETEKIKINNSLNRVLASDVEAPFDIPPFDRSAVDGYAVRAENTFGASQTNPIYFKIKGKAAIGEVSEIKVNDYEAVKIMTGTPVPEGADSVVMFEYTKKSNDKVVIVKPLSPGKNVSLMGEDVKKGEILLKCGMRIRPQDAGMMASFGIPEIKVYKKPSVAVICTGDELVDPLENLDISAGKIFNSNLYMLIGLVSKYRGIIEKKYIVNDDYDLIKEKILKAINSSCDIVLVTGGSSVGEHDLVPEIVNELGEILAHGVSMHPGMPTGFGIINDKIIFMLPGNPAAVFAAFEIFIVPCFQKMQGEKIKNPHKIVECKLKRKIPSAMGRCDFVRVKVEEIRSKFFAEPVRSGGAGILSSLVKTQGFVVVPDNLEGIDKGEVVKVNLY